jgi:hypothetical protein
MREAGLFRTANQCRRKASRLTGPFHDRRGLQEHACHAGDLHTRYLGVITRRPVQPHTVHKSEDAYNPARFGDLAAYKAKIAECQVAYEKQLAEERAPAN